jgi:hypothetical protein
MVQWPRLGSRQIRREAALAVDAGYLVDGACTPLSRKLSPQLTFGMRPLRLPDSNRLDKGWGKLIYGSSECTKFTFVKITRGRESLFRKPIPAPQNGTNTS